VVSKEVFTTVDDHLWRLTYRWALRSHANKPKRWVVARYFGKFNAFRQNRWVFGDRESGAYLRRFDWTKIVRHRMVMGTSSPDDPALTDYWADRRRKGSSPLNTPTLRLLLAQNGRCPACGDLLLLADREPQNPREWEQWIKAARKALRVKALIAPTATGSVDDPDGGTTKHLLHAHCSRRLAGATGRGLRRKPETPAGLARAGCGESRTSGSEGAPAQQCAGATRPTALLAWWALNLDPLSKCSPVGEDDCPPDPGQPPPRRWCAPRDDGLASVCRPPDSGLPLVSQQASASLAFDDRGAVTR